MDHLVPGCGLFRCASTGPGLVIPGRLGFPVSGMPSGFSLVVGSSDSRFSVNAWGLLAVLRGLFRFRPSWRVAQWRCFATSPCGDLSSRAWGDKVSFSELPGPGCSPLSGAAPVSSGASFSSGLPVGPGGPAISPSQLLAAVWSLQQGVFLSWSRLWPVQVDLFAPSANRRCSVFSPFRDPLSAGDAFLQPLHVLQAFAFPPWSFLPRVLAMLRVSVVTELTLIAPSWPQKPCFPEHPHLSLAPPVALPSRTDLPSLPRARLRFRGLRRLRLLAWGLSGAPERVGLLV